MKIEQALLDKVEFKLNKQNALAAAIGAAVWLTPILFLWSVVYTQNKYLGPIMLVLSGVLVGLAVRFHGKGYGRLFSLLAFLTYTWLVFGAFNFGIVVGGATWAIFLFGLYALGAAAAIYLARIQVPFDDHKAYSYLTFTHTHASSYKLKNRWFVVLPVFVLVLLISSFIALTVVGQLSGYLADSEKNYRVAQKEQREKNKEIDVTPEGLADKSTKEILRYSYAYHTGLLFNKRGSGSTTFPESTFKAKTLLKYLIKYRDNARAKFLLALLVTNAKRSTLLQAAVEQGDEYAKVYSAVDFGCYSNRDMGRKLLKNLLNTSNKDYIKGEIDSILYMGFEEVCRDMERSQYRLSHILNYNEPTAIK